MTSKTPLSFLSCLTYLILILLLILIICNVRLNRAIVPRLPVLTHDNVTQFPEWHFYYEDVYGRGVSLHETIDLNTFNWFYNFAPIDIHPFLNKSFARIPRNAALWLTKGSQDFSMAGFFVKREQKLTNNSYLEIIDAEHGDHVHHAIGSGIWIKKDANMEIKEEKHDPSAIVTSVPDGTREESVKRHPRSHKVLLFVALSKKRDLQNALWSKNLSSLKGTDVEAMFCIYDAPEEEGCPHLSSTISIPLHFRYTSGCKAELWWRHLRPSFTRRYEYVWVCDIDLTNFKYDRFREICKETDALVMCGSDVHRAIRCGRHWMTTYFFFGDQDKN